MKTSSSVPVFIFTELKFNEVTRTENNIDQMQATWDNKETLDALIRDYNL